MGIYVLINATALAKYITNDRRNIIEPYSTKKDMSDENRSESISSDMEFLYRP